MRTGYTTDSFSTISRNLIEVPASACFNKHSLGAPFYGRAVQFRAEL
jgi:hypothetical protein